MTTILVKGIHEETLRRLKKLKVDLDCDTWAELLDKLSRSDRGLIFSKREIAEMKKGIDEYVVLSNEISKKWDGKLTVLEESRASKRHE